jgi:hypothetical protein
MSTGVMQPVSVHLACELLMCNVRSTVLLVASTVTVTAGSEQTECAHRYQMHLPNAMWWTKLSSTTVTVD